MAPADPTLSSDSFDRQAKLCGAQADAKLWDMLSQVLTASGITSSPMLVSIRYTTRAIIDALVAEVQRIYSTFKNTLNHLQLENIVTSCITESFQTSHPALKGSRTRAQAWNEIESHPNTRANLDIPTEHSNQDATLLLHTPDEIASSLAQLSPAHNANNYAEAATLLATFFGQQTAFGPTHALDTHRQRFLNDLSPDISVQRNASSIDKFNVALVLDIKHSHLSISANKGQILDYLHALASCQPGRTAFLGILTDFKSAELIKLLVGVPKTRRRRISDQMADTTTPVTHYRSQPLSEVLKFAYAELSAPEANPCKLSLSSQSGVLVKVLQLTPRTVVAVVRTSTSATNCVVKAARNTQGALDIVREVEILKSLQDPTKPGSIPSLVYSHTSEFAIEPAGRAFRLETFGTTEDLRAALGDVVRALEWVHSHNLVHRDVRVDNLVLVRDNTYPGRTIRAVLIDFDRSAKIGVPTIYEGGYICCPEEVLHALCSRARSHIESNTNSDSNYNSNYNSNSNLPEPDPDTPMPLAPEGEVEVNHAEPLDLITYLPHPKHDFLAFVILLNQLLFPFTFQRYAYHLVERVDTKEQKRLFELWKGLRESKVWGPIVKCAESVGEDGQMTGAWEGWLELVVLL